MITPTTRDEWRAAFTEWRGKAGLTLRDVGDVLGTHHDTPRQWSRGNIPMTLPVVRRVREVCGIDLEPLYHERKEAAAARMRAAKLKNRNREYVRPYELYGPGGVPIPLPPTRAQIDAGYAALRRTGGYAPHDLTKRLPSRVPRFVPAPRRGFAPSQSGLADFV